MDLLTGLTSILGGGVTGLIGSVTQRVFEYKTKQLDIQLQKEKFAREIELKKLETAAAIDVEDSKAFKSALESEPKKYSTDTLTEKQNWLMVTLDFMRGAIRPILTVYLCAITTIIYVRAARLLNNDVILPGMAFELTQQIIQTILYLTTTCVLFWFGTRNKKK